ncbi:MAG TPA: hypothetical protein VM265_08020 [Sphingomicrobium sp.]|jgi:hypothetical protein|nr:hypothetical protein [Sphingomicrobium sp.]
MIHITEHAIERYIERVAHVDRATAYAAIASAERGVEAAARFGATVVRTATAKLVLDGTTVVTVHSRRHIDNGDLNMEERRCRYAEHRARHRARLQRWGAMQ